MKSFAVTCALAMVALLGLSMPELIVRANPGSERAAEAPGATSDIVTTAVEAGHFKTRTKALETAGTKVDVTHHLLTGVHIGTAKEMAHVQNSDIHASNGVIHVIDKVILP
jgi:uncharacterized surface protein with fasciclin (FAS1) repeats